MANPRPQTPRRRYRVEQSGHTLNYRLYDGREYVGKLIGVGEQFAKQIVRALNRLNASPSLKEK